MFTFSIESFTELIILGQNLINIKIKKTKRAFYKYERYNHAKMLQRKLRHSKANSSQKSDKRGSLIPVIAAVIYTKIYKITVQCCEAVERNAFQLFFKRIRQNICYYRTSSYCYSQVSNPLIFPQTPNILAILLLTIIVWVKP